MAWRSSPRQPVNSSAPILKIAELDVYYGRAHALQSVSLALEHGVLAVVGRNGMGKSTLCNAITGLVPATGSIELAGEEIRGLAPNQVTRRGVGYVPQGRRVWPSLTVDEHLKLVAKGNGGKWTVKRVYEGFPKLAERKGHGGAQLSGGEQQMLAIARALLLNPRLLVMDEPTEGLAPVIVEHVKSMLKTLVQEGDISVLLIEQNLGVALDLADSIAVMVNGRIARTMPAGQLAADIGLQQRLLGIGRGAHGEDPIAPVSGARSGRDGHDGNGQRDGHGDGRGGGRGDGHGGGRSIEADELAAPVEAQIFTIRRSFDDGQSPPPAGRDEPRAVRDLTRWNSGDASAQAAMDRQAARPADRLIQSRADLQTQLPSAGEAAASLADIGRGARVVEFPVAANTQRAAYVAGTFDTKARELFFLRSSLEKLGLRTVTVDLSTSGGPSPAMVHPREVARHHPRGERAVFTGDRGSAVAEMAVAFARFLPQRRDLGGIISAGGSGGTAMATAAMRELAIGLPKVMVSTVASGDVKPYVGPSDICMMYSVTDVSGINRISARVLSNAAHALAGMIAYSPVDTTGSGAGRSADTKPAIGLTMFGVTTPCVQAVSRQLEDDHDCLVFHATGTGGQSMEKLVDSGLLSAVIDVSTTEIADEIVGGRLSAGPQRLDAIIRTRIPYVGSVGALDMVNFWAMETVPSQFKGRNLYKHNQNVTLMRTTAAENAQIGRFIVDKLNRMEGPVRFLLPEKGVSMLDAEGQPFRDAAADKTLFDAIGESFQRTANRKLIRLPYHINDPQFSDALVASFHEVTASTPASSQGQGRGQGFKR